MSTMRRLRPYLTVLIGACILSFGILNVHDRCGITEGGELGMELLILHWLRISPSISAAVMDILFYAIGVWRLGKQFLKYAVVATAGYCLSYRLWEITGPLMPDLSAMPVLAAIVGALFVGIGCGLVVRVGGACSGDDALALVLSNVLHRPISQCYLFTDISVLLLSLSYLPVYKVAISLITVTLSSAIIGVIGKIGRKQEN